ncbi:unnamed protein product, partial [Darwinula stevensoni]
MMTTRKLYGKDLSAYEDLDVDQLLEQLSPEEIDILAKEVDPDDELLPPDQRCSYICEKSPSGPLDRKRLIEHINKQARETPDKLDNVPYMAGMVRGKRWIPPERPLTKQEEEIRLDLGDEYEQALGGASEDELVDLAAILGLHSMMNQDQYHASLLNKGQVGIGWDGITKSTRYKPLPNEPPNDTDPECSIQQIKDDDSSLKELNWNNIKNISGEQFERLFDALKTNTRLEVLSLANVDLWDKACKKLVDALEKNSTIRVVNVESNFLTPPLIRDLIKALLAKKSVEEFRAANQKPSILGNKIEMEITQLVEQNPNLLRLGLFFEYNDAQNRVATHLQKNCDKWGGGNSLPSHTSTVQQIQGSGSMEAGWRIQRIVENVDVSHTIVLGGGNSHVEAERWSQEEVGKEIAGMGEARKKNGKEEMDKDDDKHGASGEYTEDDYEKVIKDNEEDHEEGGGDGKEDEHEGEVGEGSKDEYEREKVEDSKEDEHEREEVEDSKEDEHEREVEEGNKEVEHEGEVEDSKDDENGRLGRFASNRLCTPADVLTVRVETPARYDNLDMDF